MKCETSLEIEAISLAGQKNWHPYLFVKVQGGINVTGVQAPLITRGRKKGEPNFRRPIPGTRLTVFVPSHPPSASRLGGVDE